MVLLSVSPLRQVVVCTYEVHRYMKASQVPVLLGSYQTVVFFYLDSFNKLHLDRFCKRKPQMKERNYVLLGYGVCIRLTWSCRVYATPRFRVF